MLSIFRFFFFVGGGGWFLGFVVLGLGFWGPLNLIGF